MRHKSFAVAEWRIDEAISDMETLDYDHHLFTELDSNQDSVVYRGGPTGYQLAQVEPHPEALAPHAVEVTVSEQPAPALSTDEAIDRMAPSTCRSCSSSTGNEVAARWSTTATTATTASSPQPSAAEAGGPCRCGTDDGGRWPVFRITADW